MKTDLSILPTTLPGLSVLMYSQKWYHKSIHEIAELLESSINERFFWFLLKSKACRWILLKTIQKYGYYSSSRIWSQPASNIFLCIMQQYYIYRPILTIFRCHCVHVKSHIGRQDLVTNNVWGSSFILLEFYPIIGLWLRMLSDF